jgi:flagellar hook-associated protein 2
VTLLSAGETSVTVARDTSSVATALSSFVTAYNAVVDELDTHRGQNAGALNGQSIVSTLSQSLQQMITYSSGSSGVTSLAGLGITLDQTGKLSFDQTTFDSVASDNPDAVTSFLGDSSTGGFLKQVSGTLDGIENSTSGVLEVALNSVKNEITDTNTRISDNQDRVNLMRDTLEAKMAAADALIASMEQQVSFMTGLFAAMKANQSA